MSGLPEAGGRGAVAELSRFRTACYGCLSARADAFFELTDALLCAGRSDSDTGQLSLLAEHQRGYGSLYGALNMAAWTPKPCVTCWLPCRCHASA
ncbi:hypothetical protein GCM10010361_11390 [Streptomyces olivaceiscleroticus]|uniref:Uncharacterized protein n=1 Tax=Streptomyces olivaceiscleroticus TaxID=68245 RepID=A0ABN0ZIS4_9ACTN